MPLKKILCQAVKVAQADCSHGSGGGSCGDEEMKDNNKEKDDNSSEDSEESRGEDPMDGQNGKDYTPKNTKGKEIANMLVIFCRLSKFQKHYREVLWHVHDEEAGGLLGRTLQKDMSSGKITTPARMAWSVQLSYPHHNKAASGASHGLVVTTVKSFGPLVPFCDQVI